MKKSILKLALSFGLLLFFASCSNDDSDTSEEQNEQTSGTFLTAKVDGVEFDSNSTLFATSVNTTNGGVAITITGGSLEGEDFSFGLSNITETGT